MEKPIQTQPVSNPDETGKTPVFTSRLDPLKIAAAPPQLRPFLFQPGNNLNPSGRPKNVFNLQARARELGPDVFKLLLGWAKSDDFRASLPAIRMILATGFPEFEKALSSPNDVPPGFENLSIAQRLDALRARRAELKQAEDNVRAGGNENAVAEVSVPICTDKHIGKSDFTENSKVTSVGSVPRGTIDSEDAGARAGAATDTGARAGVRESAPTRAREKSAK